MYELFCDVLKPTVAADVTHRDEELPFGLARLVHRDDVGVLQAGRELRLAHEARAQQAGEQHEQRQHAHVADTLRGQQSPSQQPRA